ncbi:MAG: hypothetical protein M1281_19520 [Chloroflexi bacterium]|nr:hypothetical protein [Chloroflexota bacterium]
MATPYRQPVPSANISRLLTAAVINQGFRKLLLSNPEKALNSGFNGESFSLNGHEKDLILSIHATTLTDFANKVATHHSPETHRPYQDKKPRFII